MFWDRTQRHHRTDYKLDAVCQFIYLVSTISDSLSLDTKTDKGIGKAGLFKSCSSHDSSVDKPHAVCEDKYIYGNLQCPCIYQHTAAWQPYMDYIILRWAGERRVNNFHLRSICRILGISWQDRVSNADVLSHAGLPKLQVCALRLDNTDCDGWVMSAVWRMVAWQDILHYKVIYLSMSWHWGGGGGGGRFGTINVWMINLVITVRVRIMFGVRITVKGCV